MALREFTLLELSLCDGRDGATALIAYQGKVYDVSHSFLWKGGKHQATHVAGTDLTDVLRYAPHDTDLFQRVPVVGKLVDRKSQNSSQKNDAVTRLTSLGTDNAKA